MDITHFLLEPIVFFGLLAILFLVSVLVAMAQSRHDAKQRQDSDESLQKEAVAKFELEQKIKSLLDDFAKLKTELNLKNQMYDGLKGQYAELEKDFQKLNRKPPAQAQPSPEPKNKPDQTTIRLALPKEVPPGPA